MDRAADVSQVSPRCQVGIVFALAIEAGAMLDRLKGTVTTRTPGFVLHHGGLQGRSIMLVESGVGGRAAAHATRALIAGHHPRWIITAGFAGALTPALARQDLLVPNELMLPGYPSLKLDVHFPPSQRFEGHTLHTGPLVTSNTVLANIAQKQAAAAEHRAIAVDMESYAVADICRRDMVRCMAIRVVSDALDDKLPPHVERLARQTRLVRQLGIAVGAMMRRPASIKEMFALKQRAVMCSETLAQFLVQVIDQLVPISTQATPAPPRQP